MQINLRGCAIASLDCSAAPETKILVVFLCITAREMGTRARQTGKATEAGGNSTVVTSLMSTSSGQMIIIPQQPHKYEYVNSFGMHYS